jgi:hypothetical protein
LKLLFTENIKGLFMSGLTNLTSSKAPTAARLITHESRLENGRRLESGVVFFNERLYHVKQIYDVNQIDELSYEVHQKGNVLERAAAGFYDWITRSTGTRSNTKILKESLMLGVAAVKSESNNLIPQSYLTELDKFYRKDSYTRQFPGEGGIRRHTNMVISNFIINFKSKFEFLTGLQSDLMINILALHDIGKGLDKNHHKQYENTKDVVLNHCVTLRINPGLVLSVVGNDELGNFFKGRIGLPECHAALQENFETFNKALGENTVTKEQFLEIVRIYYCSDAGAYESVKERVLDKNFDFKGKYETKFNELKQEFSSMWDLVSEDESRSSTVYSSSSSDSDDDYLNPQ